MNKESPKLKEPTEPLNQPSRERHVNYAVITGWLTTVAVITTAIVYLIIAWQNHQMIKTTQKALYLNIPPALQVYFPSYASTETESTDAFTVENAGPYSIDNLEAYLVTYKFSLNPQKMVFREQSTVLLIVNRLAAQQKFEIPYNRLFPNLKDNRPLTRAPNGNEQAAKALVLVFRREVDHKRFVKVIPFTLQEENNGALSIYSFYATRWERHGSPDTALMISMAKEIEQTEVYLFGSLD